MSEWSAYFNHFLKCCKFQVRIFQQSLLLSIGGTIETLINLIDLCSLKCCALCHRPFNASLYNYSARLGEIFNMVALSFNLLMQLIFLHCSIYTVTLHSL